MSAQRNKPIWKLKQLFWQRKNLWGMRDAYKRLMYRRFRRPNRVITRRSIIYKLHDHADLASESIYVHGTCAGYVPTLLQAAKPFFRTFIDVGANIGSVTIPVAKGFAGRVLSIEPSASNYDLLIENIALNGLRNHIDCYKVAVGDQPGKLPLYRSPTNTGDHRLSRTAEEERSAEVVDVVTLDSLLVDRPELQAPFLIKIDVQGYEAKVLASAPTLLTQPCLILAEFWPYGLRTAGSSLQEFAAFIAKYKFAVYQVSEERIAIELTDFNRIASGLSESTFEDTRDLVLTNMRLDQTGLGSYAISRST